MSDPNGGPRRFSTQTALAFVLTATFVAYAVTLRFNFVYDDLGQIVANPLVQSWDNVSVYFRGNVWMQQSAVGNYYRPIFLLWLLVNYTLFGLHPFFWHMTNVMAHLVATGLVFAVAHRLSGDRRVAIFAALVFGVHPVHLESVAWVSGVTEPLLAILLLASFLAYLEFRARGRSWRWLGLCGALYSFALLAKETAVVFPALLMAYELLFQRRDEQRKKGPAVMKAMTMFVLLTGAYLLARAQALHGLAHTTVELPTKIRVLTIPSVVWFYFKTLVAPVKLSAFYDTPYITHVSAKYVVVPITGVAIILGLLVWWWRKSRSPLVALGALWILLPIAPLLNLSVLPLGDFVHDRYLYLPSIGFALLAGMVLAKLDNRTLIGRPAGTLVALVMATACWAQLCRACHGRTTLRSTTTACRWRRTMTCRETSWRAPSWNAGCTSKGAGSTRLCWARIRTTGTQTGAWDSRSISWGVTPSQRSTLRTQLRCTPRRKSSTTSE